MKVIQWNIQSFKTQFNDLKNLLQSTNPECVCLQETLIKNNKTYPPAGYKIFTNPPARNDGHERGVAILVKSSVSTLPHPLTTNLQAVAMKVWMGKWYTVCSIYLPHVPVTQLEIENLISQLNRPYLILGDFNARSSIWNEPLTNEKGVLL